MTLKRKTKVRVVNDRFNDRYTAELLGMRGYVHAFINADSRAKCDAAIAAICKDRNYEVVSDATE